MCCYTDDMAKDDIAQLYGKVDALAAAMTKGFALMTSSFEAVASDIAEIKGEITDMKSDLAGLRTELHEFREETRSEFVSIHHELAQINARLDHLEQNYGNLKGVTVEIDELRLRMTAIERHLGISKKIAA